jgi:predicted RecB family nuclease
LRLQSVPDADWETRKRSDYGELHRSLQREYRRGATDFLLQQHSASRVTRAPECVFEATDEGNTLLLCAALVTGAFSFNVDALTSDGECSEVQSELTPVLFSFSEKPSRHDKELLAMSGVLLERVSGRQSQHGTLLYGRSFRKLTVTLSKLRDGASESLRHLESLSQGETPKRHLNDHCKVCQYEPICRREAERADDLSLLRGISPKEVARLKKRGIFTVTQYSYTYRARRRTSRPRSRLSKHERSLNALAIRTDTIYVAQTPEIPDASVQVFLDIEGLPHRNFYYLLGATVIRDEKRQSVAFWADSESSERDLWFGFARLLEEFDDVCIFHYGSYDAQALSRLARSYAPTSSLMARLDGATFNVLSAIYGKVHFPCYANDLKSVAASLGFSWRTPSAGGIDSIVWRHQWETSGDQDLKKRLVEYNDDDRSALVVVVDALRRLQTPGDASLQKPALEVNQLRSETTYDLISKSAALPDLQMINRRSYFDYQRQRVNVRTASSGKRCYPVAIADWDHRN